MAAVLVVGLVHAYAGAHDRKAAREAFHKANQYLRTVYSRDLHKREEKQYERAIRLFRKVVTLDPTYPASDDAVHHIARLYDEKAHRFGEAEDFRQAINFYEFLAREYPTTKHKDGALKRASFLRSESASWGGRSPAEPARGRENATQQAAPSAAERHSESSPPNAEPLSPPAVAKPSSSQSQARAGAAGGPATVTKIRYWSGPEYTRVVIDLDGEAAFEKEVLQNPYRVYFDLHNARLRSGLPESYDVSDVFIDSVRVGQNRPGVVRVVLDFDQPGDTTVFRLHDPFRIVIDTKATDGRRNTDSVESSSQSLKTASAEIALEEGTATTRSTREVVAGPEPNMHGDYTLTRTLGLKVGRIVLDPGHGGHDTGAIGPDGLEEKDLVLDIAKRLHELLKEGLATDVILTRKEDVFIPLEERTAIANQKGADLFISIHANSSPNRKAQGVETFYLSLATTPDERAVASRENAGSQRTIRELEDLLRQITKGDYNEESRDLAHVVQRHLFDDLSRERESLTNRGVKRAPFIVLVGSNMPAILTEVGFVSNPDEEEFLTRGKSRQRLAEALYKGIEQYFAALGSNAAPAASESSQK
ncbi:MAG TPA: N-acetylmuramoyl-L-alanine amidase [Acidobacteriota bacterium]|nr:N-acetylmuramoyl-L-alanine amidase [Acidobacteriota bacterium]